MDNKDKKQRFSPTKFLEGLGLQIKTIFLFVIKKTEYLIPVTAIFSYFSRRVTSSFYWFIEPRKGADLFFFRFELLYYFIVRLFIFWCLFSCWRWCNGFLPGPYGVLYTSPLDTYFKVIDGSGRPATLVDYYYMIERYSGPMGVHSPYFYACNSDYKFAGYWQQVYMLNKKLIHWRPTSISSEEFFFEINRMISHFRNHKYPIKPSPLRHLGIFYGIQDFVVVKFVEIHISIPRPLSWILGRDRFDFSWSGFFTDFFHRHGVRVSPLNPDYIYDVMNYVGRLRIWYDYVLEEYPNWIKNGLPDEWYLRNEDPISHEGMGVGGYYAWDTDAYEPIRRVYRSIFRHPWDKYRLARSEYFANFFPHLPNWGPGRGSIKNLFNDMFHIFWFRYLAPSGSFKFFARFSDLLLLFDTFGTNIVYCISIIYGLPFLVVTYVFFFIGYFFTPLRIFVSETVMHFVDNVFMHSLETFTLLENYFFMPEKECTSADMIDLLSTAWMGFLIIPFLVVMVFIPMCFVIGFCLVFVVRPGIYVYRVFIDEETGTLRTKEEILQLCKDQYVVITSVIGFRFTKNLYSVKSLLTSLPHHNPPITFLPRRWFRTFWYRWPGVKQSAHWWVYHSKTSAVLGLQDYLQFRADTLFIRRFGEEAFQKELDKRYWITRNAFDDSWGKHNYIVNSLLNNRWVFFIFSWYGHILLFSFIFFWCAGVVYKHALFLRLFSDAIFPNGLTPLQLGTAAYPKSIKVGSDLDDQREEDYEPFSDLELLLYAPEEQLTHIDHYAEFVLVVSKWFLVYFSFFIFVAGCLLFFYRGPRAIFMAYVTEVVLGFIVLIFGMGWSAYAFAAGFPEWDLIGFRGFLNAILALEEWLFDNYLTGYFADDLTVLNLERYMDQNRRFLHDVERLYFHRNFHVRYHGKNYMRVYSPIEEVLWPVADAIESYRDVKWKAFLEKHEPNLKKLRVYCWGEDKDDEYAKDPDEDLGRLKKPKTGSK
jgi:hypothetical protein